jgi:hypothetical protein
MGKGPWSLLLGTYQSTFQLSSPYSIDVSLANRLLTDTFDAVIMKTLRMSSDLK